MLRNRLVCEFSIYVIQLSKIIRFPVPRFYKYHYDFVIYQMQSLLEQIKREIMMIFSREVFLGFGM